MNDRLVIESGSCSFQTRSGQKQSVNGQISWSRPMAKVDRILMHDIEDYLTNVLDCGIEVEWQDRRFVFTFRSQPKFTIRADPMPFVISLASVNRRLADAGLPPAERLSSLLKADGAAMIGWILKSLHGKDLTYHASDAELSWKPPPKKEGYAPLTGNASASTPLERLIGPAPRPVKAK